MSKVISITPPPSGTAGDECLVTEAPIPINISAPKTSMYCLFGSPRWTIGNDLCDASSFTLYSACNTSFCDVNASDYFVKGPTYICCHGESQTRCNELISE